MRPPFGQDILQSNDRVEYEGHVCSDVPQEDMPQAIASLPQLREHKTPQPPAIGGGIFGKAGRSSGMTCHAGAEPV